jgi:UDP-sulfoquinovose synthase
MTAVVLGYDGYIGHALTLRLLANKYKVIGVDNYSRRKSVDEMGSTSAILIDSISERGKALQDLGDFTFFYTDLNGHEGYTLLKHIFKEHTPHVVVNLAQQPSAPYSQISVDHARYSAINNIASTINVLWAMKEYGQAHLVQIGTMGEYDPAIGVPIPEGTCDLALVDPGAGNNFQEQENDKVINKHILKNVMYPRSGGSFYHTSKISATYFIEYCCRVYNINATDIMQGIVYGNYTPEIQATGLHTRCDSDEAFGTVVNRFIVQTVLEHPLTIYGEGLHKRGFLALNDSVQCLMLAIENNSYKGYRVWNQLDTCHTMNEVADLVIKAGEEKGYFPIKKYIESPRVENTGDFYYEPVVDKLKTLGFSPTRFIYDEALFTMEHIDRASVGTLLKVVMPKILWR